MLLLLLVLILIISFIAGLAIDKTGIFTLKLIRAYLAMVLNYWIVIMLWKLLTWIVNGDLKNSRIEDMNAEEKDRHLHKKAHLWTLFIAMPTILLIAYFVILELNSVLA